MKLEGHIIEFIESGTIRVGYVRKENYSSVQVVDQRDRQFSVTRPRVAIIHQAVSEPEFKKTLQTLLEQIEEFKNEIDAELLWNSINSDIREFSVRELAQAYFGKTSSTLEAALFRKLEQEQLLFKRSNSRFQPIPKEQVVRERFRKEREHEKQDFRKKVEKLLRHAMKTTEVCQEPIWEDVLDRLGSWLRHRNKDEVGEILEQITSTSKAKSKAYEILFRAGKIKPHEDRFLLIRGIHSEFPSETIEACDALAEFETDQDRIDLTFLPAIAIDDDDTCEVDDALTVQEVENKTIVGIHIADVSTFVSKGDPLDQEAFKRCETIYLPNISVMMFPERLATDLASLIQGFPRPAFTIEAEFNSENELSGHRIRRSLIKVSDRLSYDEADRALRDGHSALNKLHEIAIHLKEIRKNMGGQTTQRPELKVRVHDNNISVRQIKTNSPTRHLVSEMMILANHIAAEQATILKIPIIFRTQEPPESEPDNFDYMPEALQFERKRKHFKRSRLSLSPGEHSGLGLRAYTQISSPIRRYADIVTQRQFISAMENQPLPYNKEELLTILTTVETAQLETRRLEEESTTYWILKYLSQEQRDKPLSALLLDRKGNVELANYFIRGKLSDKEDWTPGEDVLVEIESIDLERLAIKFRSVG